MNIAILGSTSQIARDLIQSFFSYTDYCLILFGRQVSTLRETVSSFNDSSRFSVKEYSEFSFNESFDVIINFVGVGDPALAKEMGNAIFDITQQYDLMALEYLKQNPKTKYIFLSSGAVFGGEYLKPINEISCAQFDVNHLGPTDWYGIAKLYAETKHRALCDHSIVDIRVFNYFSHTQDMGARFLITDVVRAIRDKEIFKTSSTNIIRDFITPIDFFNLIQTVIEVNNKLNLPLDCYTKEPVDKLTLLKVLNAKFGLEYELEDVFIGIDATGSKTNYFSQNRRAESLGYKPSLSSVDGVIYEIGRIPSINR